MIAYLHGIIIQKKERYIVLDVRGVGYKAFMAHKTLSTLPEVGADLKLFCFQHVRENAIELYGFLDQASLEFFEVLDAVPGVGPKMALEIASIGSLEAMKEKITAHDTAAFQGIPGIGPKKARAIILELSGKLSGPPGKGKSALTQASTDEAATALVNMGFKQQEVRDALARVPQNVSTEERIKTALRNLRS